MGIARALAISIFVGVVSPVIASQSSSGVPTQGLVSWWPGDGNANDVVGGNHGVRSATGATFEQGVTGQAFRFNGTTGRVLIPGRAGLSPTDRVSVHAWIKTAGAVSALMGIYDRQETQDGFGLQVTGNGRAKFRINGGSGSATGTSRIDDGLWHHVAGTYDRAVGSIAVYVDGVREATSVYGALIDYVPEPRNSIAWLENSSGTQWFFAGWIDEIQVFDRALTANEVLALYLAPTGRGRTASCTFRNGSGTNPADYMCTTQPIVGTSWLSSITTNAGTALTIVALGFGGTSQVPMFGGELLVAPFPLPIVTGLGSHSVPIPGSASLVGFQLPTQGIRVDDVGGVLTLVPLNAQDLVLGL